MHFFKAPLCIAPAQVRLLQDIAGHDGAVWVMRLSKDCKLLATAGQDGIIRVWSVGHYSK